MKRDDPWLEIEDFKMGPDKLMQHVVLCLPPTFVHLQSQEKKKTLMQISQIKN